MLHGNRCVVIWHDSLVVRCGPTDWADHLKKKHVREMDITGRSMKGWLLVDAPAIADTLDPGYDPAALAAWILDEVDGIVERLCAELGDPAPTVVATGGLAPVVLPHCHTVDHHEPWLTLEGLRLVYEKNLGDGDA